MGRVQDPETKYTVLGGRDYHDTRLTHPTVRFSLRARTEAITEGLRKLFPRGIPKLLDVGGADGLMARGILQAIQNIENIYVLDLDQHLLTHNPFGAVRGDCTLMPFSDQTFDAVTAAALIEHLPDPDAFLSECNRVLKPGGALLLTCPAPFFEWLATRAGYLKDSGHVARYSISKLKSMCVNAGLSPIMAHKFMPSPFGFPGYSKMELLMKKLGLGIFMLNQFVACSKIREN